MPPRRMFPFAPSALHQAIRANDTMPAPTCANRRADGEMHLCAEAIARDQRWRHAPHGRICITCEGSGWRMAMAAAFSVAEFVSVRKGSGWRSVATARAKALWQQEGLDRLLGRLPKRVSYGIRAARFACHPECHSSGRPWQPTAYRLFETCPQTTG